MHRRTGRLVLSLLILVIAGSLAGADATAFLRRHLRKG
jgi:hypothetical protein